MVIANVVCNTCKKSIKMEVIGHDFYTSYNWIYADLRFGQTSPNDERIKPDKVSTEYYCCKECLIKKIGEL